MAWLAVSITLAGFCGEPAGYGPLAWEDPLPPDWEPVKVDAELRLPAYTNRSLSNELRLCQSDPTGSNHIHRERSKRHGGGTPSTDQ